jgi:2-polyprenyl-3-methyl-5-hydroxy-6-metoxy-1,4-benzoquinol methylase
MSEYQDYGYENSAFRCAHRYLLPALLSMLNKNQNKLILDVGCGNGAIAAYLLEHGYQVYGIDASETGVSIANNQHPGHFFLQDINSEQLPKELMGLKFDTVISTEVIEHLYDPRKFVRFCKGVLAKNGSGQMILSTPYHGYLKNLALSISGKMDNHFTALWDGGHIKFWSKKTLSELVEEQGFKVDNFKGAGRIPYLWKSMLLSCSID